MSPHLLLNHILKCTFILLLRAQHVSCVISPLVCPLFSFLFYFYVSAFLWVFLIFLSYSFLSVLNYFYFLITFFCPPPTWFYIKITVLHFGNLCKYDIHIK